MTVLLLAACGKVAGRSATSPSSAASPSEASRTAVLPSATRPPVTVPRLGSADSRVASTSAARSTVAGTRIPLTPVGSLPSTSHPTATPTRTTSNSAAAAATPPTPTTDATLTTQTQTQTTRSSSRSTTADPTTISSTRKVSSDGLAGKVVAIDPGHNGANGEHPEIINQRIDGGYGQRNICNTTGTQTDAGYTEHEFTWHVASYLRPLLEARGIKVVMTRFNDTGVGPCTDKRAGIENSADSDAVVSIHGDGAPAEVRGFYVLTATRPPAGSAIAAASLRLASCIASAAVDAGFPASNTLGSGGLWKRDDLTGLNRSTRPKILIECGNMRNAAEAALMSSTEGQKRYAQALAQGVFAFLQG
jgi:N-acetylmuramoyl-L-alanine amidase